MNLMLLDTMRITQILAKRCCANCKHSKKTKHTYFVIDVNEKTPRNVVRLAGMNCTATTETLTTELYRCKQWEPMNPEAFRNKPESIIEKIVVRILRI